MTDERIGGQDCEECDRFRYICLVVIVMGLFFTICIVAWSSRHDQTPLICVPRDLSYQANPAGTAGAGTWRCSPSD